MLLGDVPSSGTAPVPSTTPAAERPPAPLLGLDFCFHNTFDYANNHHLPPENVINQNEVTVCIKPNWWQVSFANFYFLKRLKDIYFFSNYHRTREYLCPLPTSFCAIVSVLPFACTGQLIILWESKIGGVARQKHQSVQAWSCIDSQSSVCEHRHLRNAVLASLLSWDQVALISIC